MKQTVLLLFMLLTTTAFATLPFNVEEENRFDAIETTRRVVVKAPYTFSSTAAASSTVSLNKSLPAEAIVVRVFAHIGTQIASASNNTLSLDCDSTGDLFAATDLTPRAADTFVQGVQTAATSTMINVDSGGCNLQMSVGAGASGVTAGALTWFIDYILASDS